MYAKWLTVASLAAVFGSAWALAPARLRCEYLVNPIGIDETSPRLSWIVTSKKHGDRQTAYQILVSSKPGGNADLWDSGRIESSETSQIAYGGQALQSGQRTYWRVRVWDASGKPTEAKAGAFWEMGLLQPEDWKARWVGQAAPRDQVDTSDARWIWYPETPEENADRQFMRTVDVPAGAPITSAQFGVGADDAYQAFVNGQKVFEGRGWASYGHADIKSLLKPGRNVITVIAHNESGPAGLVGVGQIRFADGTTQRFSTDAQWGASKDGKSWIAAVLQPKDEVATRGKTRWNASAPPAPYLRKSFGVASPIVRARAYVSAKGLYTFWIDGKRIGDESLRPGDTDYHKRIQYQTYDLTALLEPGRHVAGLVLGNGWYSGHISSMGPFNYGPKPMGLVQIEIERADGAKQIVATDGTWRAKTGPVLMDDILMGEDYDARKELGGWSTPEYSAVGWSAVATEPIGDVPLIAQRSEGVRVLQELTPKAITEPKPGVFVYDLGQNMVGWARLKAQGEAGKTIKLRFAEMLNPDGTIYTTNLRSARATDNYTLKGGGREVFEPTFTFHGFRYVEVTGYPGKPGRGAITGVVASSDTPRTGWFSCSDPLVNQLVSNIYWGQRGNYLEIPTDCPQRDERLGWMGDAQIFVRTAAFNNDIAPFMTKWEQDVVDAQTPEGGFANFSPRASNDEIGAPAWGDAGIIVPWTIYQAYGDKRILERNFDAMAKWIRYIDEANPDHRWVNRSGANFGDWLNVDADMPRDVLGTAYFAYSTRLLAQIAQVLGKDDDARQYRELADAIRDAFITNYVTADGHVTGDTQTGYVLALRFRLLPEQVRPLVAKRLVDDILIARKGHLSTGFVGVGYLTPTLTQIGRSDVAYKLLLNDTYPSWGYSIRQGATTIWERWDGWTKEKGFQDPGMNSFNHYSLGSVGEWLYSSVAGIDHATPGFGTITIAPIPGGDLKWAKGKLDTIRGTVTTSWKREGDRFVLDVTIPANTTARVILPGEAIEVPKDAKSVQGGYEVGGGTYRFVGRDPVGARR